MLARWFDNVAPIMKMRKNIMKYTVMLEVITEEARGLVNFAEVSSVEISTQ